MKKDISIIGGDLRIVNLAKLLCKGDYKVHTYALEKSIELLENYPIEFCATLEEAIQKSEMIISSVPLSKDGGKTVSAPYSDERIDLKDLKSKLLNKKFIAGNITKELKKESLIETHDLLEIEEYAILNAIATAEGAIQIAMEEYPRTLSGSKILVMGFGRIGKILAKILQGIGSQVYCEARKKEDLAYIKAYGYTPVDLKELDENLQNFDIIINNIPVLILDKLRLDLLKKDVLIIDLASKPGGVDFEYAKQKNIKTIWALALPGKVAPLSSAEYIKEVLEKNII